MRTLLKPLRFAALSALLLTVTGCVHHHRAYYADPVPAYRPPVVVGPRYYAPPPPMVYERPRYARPWHHHRRHGW